MLFTRENLGYNGRMHLQSWLGVLPLAKFVEQYYGRLPHSGSCAGRVDPELASWDTIEALLAAPESDVLVVRRNQQREGDPPRDRAAAESLVAEGYTLLVRHAERHHAALRDLADAFARDFAAPVDIHLYITPGDQFGFAWHYDAEEVFILQTAGRKQYSLRKNTVNPWPTVETLPADMHYEREIMPLMRCDLSAGDWLYIPSGYWHKAEALPGEPAISLAIGVLGRTGVDVYDLARRHILDSLLWRQRLPVLGAASPLDADAQRQAMRELLSTLATDAAKLFQSEALLDALLQLAKEPSAPR